jgi:cobalt-zinc-cadmium efflux system protein
MAVTGIMMVAEIVGGFWTNSLALVSDAGHMFTHFFALSISFAAIVCASRKSCHHRTFGFYRVEILAALLNSLFLFVATFWILAEGIKRILNPAPILGVQMFIIAIIGLLVNLASVFILRGTHKDDLNIKSAFLHMLGDTLSSVAIVIGAVVIYFTGWNIIDPILSIGIGVVILLWGWNLFKDSVNILLESAPKGMNTEDITKTLAAEISSIDEITDMHVWEITTKMYSMTAHVKLKSDVDRQTEKQVLAKIKHIVDNKFDIEHTTIEFS